MGVLIPLGWRSSPVCRVYCRANPMNSEMTSNILMLMAAPTPVRSRAYSAASTPVSE